MTGEILFRKLAPILAPGLERVFKRRDLCVLTTRIVIQVGQYFGIEIRPVAVRAIVYNRIYEDKIERGAEANGDWSDGSWAVGIGFGHEKGKWSGHLIASTDEMFADFSIGQAERPEKQIVTGPAILGPYAGQEMWSGKVHGGEVTIEYQRIFDETYRHSPDWQRGDSTVRFIVGALIRAIRD